MLEAGGGFDKQNEMVDVGQFVARQTVCRSTVVRKPLLYQLPFTHIFAPKMATKYKHKHSECVCLANPKLKCVCPSTSCAPSCWSTKSKSGP